MARLAYVACAVLAACGGVAGQTATKGAYLASAQEAHAQKQANAAAALGALQQQHAELMEQKQEARQQRQAAAAAAFGQLQEQHAERVAQKQEQRAAFAAALGTMTSNHFSKGGKTGVVGATSTTTGTTTTITTVAADNEAEDGEAMTMPMMMEDNETSDEECSTVAETAASVEDLSILLEAVSAAGDDVVDLLSDKDAKLTVLAPTNDAFVKLLGTLGVSKEELFANQTLLLGVLSYHVVPDAAVLAADLTDGQVLETLLGPTIPLTVEKSGDSVTLDGVGSSASVVIPDVEACAAIVHVIDNVLLPVG